MGNRKKRIFTVLKFDLMKSRLFLSSFLSLIIGTMIYLLFRSPNLKIFHWLNNIGIDVNNSNMRAFVGNYNHLFPKWFLFSLPDGLWISSYVMLILVFWDIKLNYQCIFWILIVPLIALFSEIGQFLNFFPGTFDYYDLLFYSLGFSSPILYTNKKIKFKLYEKI